CCIPKDLFALTILAAFIPIFERLQHIKKVLQKSSRIYYKDHLKIPLTVLIPFSCDILLIY
ncbi:MAG: hypothetical protein M3Z01_00605, partial [Thermoproteota archaeon]|nr:hypothetical protein [Thermoproteota archaeon]